MANRQVGRRPSLTGERVGPEGTLRGGRHASASGPESDGSPRGNRLLRALPVRDMERIAPQLSVRMGKSGAILYDVDEPTGHVWFPLSGVWSWITIMDDGAKVEVAT